MNSHTSVAVAPPAIFLVKCPIKAPYPYHPVPVQIHATHPPPAPAWVIASFAVSVPQRGMSVHSHFVTSFCRVTSDLSGI